MHWPLNTPWSSQHLCHLQHHNLGEMPTRNHQSYNRMNRFHSWKGVRVDVRNCWFSLDLRIVLRHLHKNHRWLTYCPHMSSSNCIWLVLCIALENLKKLLLIASTVQATFPIGHCNMLQSSHVGHSTLVKHPPIGGLRTWMDKGSAWYILLRHDVSQAAKRKSMKLH